MQKIRDTLATELMGWHVVSEDPPQYHWADSDGRFQMVDIYWHPDTDWTQCGPVIDAMRARGTDERPISWSMHQEPMGIWAVQLWQFDDAGHEYMIADAREESFTAAVALAAYRAIIGE